MRQWLLRLFTLIYSTVAMSDSGTTEGLLREQIALIDLIMSHVEVFHKPRLLSLKAKAQRLLDAAQDLPDYQEIKPASFNEMETDYIFDFYFNRDFIRERIQTPYFADPALGHTQVNCYQRIYEIAELFGIQKQMIDAENKQIHLQSPKNSMLIFDRLVKKFDELQSYNLPSDLTQKIETVQTPVFGIIGQATARGDGFDVFKASIPICKSIHALIPDLRRAALDLELTEQYDKKILAPPSLVVRDIQDVLYLYVNDVAKIEKEVLLDTSDDAADPN